MDGYFGLIMNLIPLEALPNQNFTVTLGNNTYNFRINTCVNITAVTLYRNLELLFSGERVPPFTPVIPYRYLESGNFFFITQNEEYPIYDKFGVSQFLLYATQDELETFRNATN